MDFKSRFQGKTSVITRDGGIDNIVKMSNAPINKVEKISINKPNAQEQLIQYGTSEGNFS